MGEGVQCGKWANGLFAERSILEQNVSLGDYLGNTDRHAHISSAQDEDFISIENGVAVSIKEHELVAVLLPDFFSEFAYAGVPAIFLQLILLSHPCLKDCGERHHQNREVDMGTEGVGIVSSRPLYEPRLLCLAEQPVFNWAQILSSP